MLRIKEAAEEIGMSYQFVYKRIRSGEIPAVQFGDQWRIEEDDLDAWRRQQYEKRMPRGE